MSNDLVTRLRGSVSQARAIDRGPLLEEAAREIESLEAKLQDSHDYAYKFGFFLSTLEMIRDHDIDAKKVAKKALKRFPG